MRKGSAQTRGRKRDTPPKRRYSTAIGSSNVKMVADRHRHAAYHNKNWRRAFYVCQHRWPWPTSNVKNFDFKWFFGDYGCKSVKCDEMGRNRPRFPANRNCHRFSRVSWALAQISCYVLLDYWMDAHWWYFRGCNCHIFFQGEPLFFGENVVCHC